jgi:uncharacterized membrane protein YdjX (TVP38/TMEM64 family)
MKDKIEKIKKNKKFILGITIGCILGIIGALISVSKYGNTIVFHVISLSILLIGLISAAALPNKKKN